MVQEKVIEHIKQAAAQTLPPGSSLWLYGSRARGDARPDSDYDLLILLDKDELALDDCSKYSYPLYFWGTGVGEEVNAHVYTKKDWMKWKHSPFHENVEEDKIVLI
jgi:predicted nucleotidyltransferase